MAMVMLFLRQTTGKTERYTHFCMSLKPVFTRDCGNGVHFMDEPTGALNSQTGLHVLDTLTAFNQRGQSVVMVTHDMRSARRGSRILYLKDGVILGECNLGKYVAGDAGRHEKLSAFLAEMGW